MKRIKFILVGILALAMLVSVLPACQTELTEKVEAYVAIAPQIFHPGEETAISVALLGKGEKLASSPVEVSLLQNGKKIFSTAQEILGKDELKFKVPENLLEGNYELQIKVNGFKDKTEVKVEKSILLFLETDKPIYKPGQEIYIRVLTLNSELKPLSEDVVVEVLDAKGIKIFRKEVSTDDYGMVSLNLPLSSEPNLGIWKINATSGSHKTQIDVRVEKYVLPKYEIKVELPKEWFLADEKITGKVSAEYSFGKPVKGELEIKASRYVGEWEEFATFSKEIDGETDFELPPTEYVAGVPEARGMGNVTLDVTVKETATGYEEKTTELLTISETPLSIQIIPESSIFKPTLPFNFLLVTETPDNKPQDVKVAVDITYLDEDFNEITSEEKEIETKKGKALVKITSPEKSVALNIEASSGEGDSRITTTKAVEAGYSPSGNFIHIEQVSEGTPKLGEKVEFKVYSTKEAANFYYEVISRGRVVFSNFTQSNKISFTATPLMSPASKLLVYQILPNSEVAADYIPFNVKASYPQEAEVNFDREEAKPGENLKVEVKTEGEAKVGISVVDKSVFILAENRLNLQQVFDELEKLYMKPQAELHSVSIYTGANTKGAGDIFKDVGVVVLSNKKVPQGKEYEGESRWGQFELGIKGEITDNGALEEAAVPPPKAGSEELAEVGRVRQFFPETWLWTEVTTDSDGKATLETTAPDTITTWMLHAVAISKEKGLGIAEDQLKVFQPFFIKVDFPYSAVRGEEFPLKVAIYNYLDEEQEVTVKLAGGDWFELLDNSAETVSVPVNDVGSVEFKISPTKLGQHKAEITAQSKDFADAVQKQILIQAEGVEREVVENLVLSAGSSKQVSTFVPESAVINSGRALVAVTSSFLTQTIEGLESLIRMPFGCGEQNMMMMAPDVFITKYLEESGQLKPEIMAKAEKLMITGYQRQLTYRHDDGSFSAFGNSDEEGSLWLTAFVLKTFSQAKDLIYIDQSVLDEAEDWILAHQKDNGSFESVGFICHQDIFGGLEGKTALTSYVAISLMEAGEKSGSDKAISYLEQELDEIDDPYTMAITAYAFELASSDLRDKAHEKLMEMAKEDENGLHWGKDVKVGEKCYPSTAQVENTAYATLALTKHGDKFNAGRAAKWLVSQRNAYGGFGSTQDTVVALQALTEYSEESRTNVALRVKVSWESGEKELEVNSENFDVLQVVEVPVGKEIEINAEGDGEAVVQVVKRFNLLQPEREGEEILKLSVDYDTDEVEVNDTVKVSAAVEFNPPIETMKAEMVVMDISVPTGFAPVEETLDKVVMEQKKIKRYEVAGRKVIFYIEGMEANERISFSFDVKALYPVKAKGVSSEAYSYYDPDVKSEVVGGGIVVKG